MKLTQFTDYSLRALIYLATHGDKLCTVKEISSAFDISYNHMVKVVHGLSKHGYIDARKGKGGGILLAKPANQINLADVVCCIEPDLELVECFSSNKDSSSNKRKAGCRIAPVCGLKSVFIEAQKAFIDELRQHTLADIVFNRQALIQVFEVSGA